MPNFPCSSLGIAALEVVGEEQELPPGTGIGVYRGTEWRAKQRM